MAAEQPRKIITGIVKQALSGDTVIVRGQPRGGPPAETTVCLSNVFAPKLARRGNPGAETTGATVDEPYAWEAREFLRSRLIGKEVTVVEEYSPPSATRLYGFIYLGKDLETADNITELVVAEGLVQVRRGGIRQSDEKQTRLINLEDTAKSAGKGQWAPGTGSEHIRDVMWVLENPRNYVDSHHAPVQAIIEHVRDASTIRAFVLPTFQYITVMLSGVKSPMFKLEGDKQVAEPYAEEAKFFVECRLLQREVKIHLEGVSNQNLLGSVIHPNGNIAELLLKEGYSRCVDWSMGVVSQGAEKYRAAEKIAKEKNLRIWKDYVAPTGGAKEKEKSFSGKVVEIVNGDSMVVKLQDGSYKKIFLASIRPPRATDTPSGENKPESRKMRPLYDIPYMYEAREFLRKKLIGKKVNVAVDYVQPASQGFPERTCCTVTIGGINVAEAITSKGLCTVIRYRQDDDSRSSFYDTLLAAEAKAQKNGIGLHSRKEPPIHRVADVSGDVPKAKQFLPFLQRAGRSNATVEFVASGSRLRLFLPKETCLITLLLSGIECPRAARPGPGGSQIPSDPYGEQALTFTKELSLQREVEVEVEAIDKGGNFIGWMFVDGVNVSVALVEEGLSKVHFTAERSKHYKTLTVAEENAKAKKLNVWSNFVEEPSEVEVKDEPKERKVNYKSVVLTEVTDECHFYAQYVENGQKLEQMMNQLRTDLEANPPLPGSYTPKKGDLCAAKFIDGMWYRAKVEKAGNNAISVLYIDYGNREVTDTTKIGALPAAYVTLPPQANLFALACVTIPVDYPEFKKDAIEAFQQDTMNRELLLNVEYKNNGIDYVVLADPETKEDVAQALIADGLFLLENRRERKLAKLVSDYRTAQEKAKSSRRNIWCYGDITADEASEFGYKK